MSTALTPVEQAELAKIEAEELALSAEGIDFKPVRYKVNKDLCQFTDPFGAQLDELRGVVVFKQKTRGHWQEGDKNPLCSSLDALHGTDREGNAHDCLVCPFNQWGSGKGGAGKACKEMRRLFIVLPGSSVPATVSFPPTSIGPLDSYYSARVQKRIADTSQETVLKLAPAKSDQGGFTYAIAAPKLGAKITEVGQIMEYRRIRQLIQQAAAKMAVESDEYPTETTEAPETKTSGDVF